MYTIIYLCDSPSQIHDLSVWEEVMKLVPRDLYPGYQDRDARQILVARLVSLGMTHLLAEDKVNPLIACVVAQTVLYYERAPGFQSKLIDLCEDCKREVVKFFHKRNGCTCLKKRYDRLRTQTKVGTCSFCHKECERKKLMICNQCTIIQYCSQECQRGDWPRHRDWCEQLRADHTH